MPKTKEAQGFEVTQYSKDAEVVEKKLSAIKEVVQDLVRNKPNIGVQVHFTGNMMRLSFHCSQMHLPVKMRETEQLAKETLNEAVKLIKKGVKEKIGESLDLKERKELANYSVQKTSLNERYYYSAWRFYEID